METPPSPNPPPDRILLVDDVPANLAVLTAVLEPEGYDLLVAPNGPQALDLAARAQPRLILMDVMMPGVDGLETCRRLKSAPATADIPILFLTACAETASVVAGFEAGGVDYIVKPFRPEEVLSRVRTHLQVHRLARELKEKNAALEARTAELTAEIDRRRTAESALRQADDHISVLSDLEAERWNLSGLVGGSNLLQKILEDVRRLHQFAATSVLITGESGTGKELVARAIHFGSARARAPFVPVNCVAIPSELAESMLFGHVRGAFTGATSDRKGYFELAHGGTLFLDEIGDMPLPLQVKLLRVLEDGCVTPVGSTQTRRVEVRVIAATNADLDSRIADGAFRQDLYFRIARYRILLPPLRERLDDVPLLAAHFLRRFATEMGLRPPPLSQAAAEVLQGYDFPGNVRELRNVIERALIESGGAAILAQHLQLPRRTVATSPGAGVGVVSRQPRAAGPRPPGVAPAHARAHSRATPATVPPGVNDPGHADATADARDHTDSAVDRLPLNLAAAEDLLIQRALQQTRGNIADAARLLGVHRTRIYRKLAQDDPAPSA